MRVVSCAAFGPLDGLRVVEQPDAPCEAGQVRISVTAAGVNFVDALFVQGRYQIKPALPFTPGSEVAGLVTEVGAQVDGLTPGDRVFANCGLGGYASEVVVDARRVLPTPAELTDGQAATFTQSYSTAWFALHHRAHAAAGQWMLVLGAGGGVGLAAVDVGRAMGLRIIAAASTEAKRHAALERGAEAVIDTVTEDTKQQARDISGGGVDLVYDPVGGDQGEQALRALGEDGQLLVIGFASGDIPRLPANQVLLRNRRVTGVDWGAWSATNPLEQVRVLTSILSAVEAGSLDPVEPVAHPLEHAASALDDQIHRRVVGKTVLVP